MSNKFFQVIIVFLVILFVNFYFSQPLISPAYASTEIVQVTVYLDGIGVAGDSINTNNSSLSNKNPLHKNILFTLQLTPLANQNNPRLVGESEKGDGVGLTYDNEKGYFTGTVTMQDIIDGTYSYDALISLDSSFLEGQITNTQLTINGQQVAIPSVTLVNGDINQDGSINALDYNILISCYGATMIHYSSSCIYPPTDNSSGADLTDDGVVNGSDYNLLLREMSTHPTTNGNQPNLNVSPSIPVSITQ